MSGQDLHGAVFAGMTFTFESDRPKTDQWLWREVWNDCSACDCRKINLKGSNLDGSTDTFAGFEGGNLQDSSWLAYPLFLEACQIWSKPSYWLASNKCSFPSLRRWRIFPLCYQVRSNCQNEVLCKHHPDDIQVQGCHNSVQGHSRKTFVEDLKWFFISVLCLECVPCWLCGRTLQIPKMRPFLSWILIGWEHLQIVWYFEVQI